VFYTYINKIVDAKNGKKELTFWGTELLEEGALYVDDCADACIHLMKYSSPDIIY
jgi:GDP-L-fucose synthase